MTTRDADRLAGLALRMTEARVRGTLLHWAHIDFRPGSMEVLVLRCKGCGEEIKRAHPVPVLQGTLVRQLVTLPGYTEMVIELDRPRGIHVTHGCQACAARDWSRPAIEAWWLADVAVWLEGPDSITDPALARFVLGQAERVVLGWRAPRHLSESVCAPGGAAYGG